MCGTEQVKNTFAFTLFQNGRHAEKSWCKLNKGQVSFHTVLQILCAKKTSLKAKENGNNVNWLIFLFLFHPNWLFWARFSPVVAILE